jgi:hypothetical protein
VARHIAESVRIGDLRGANGDSGGGIFTTNNEFLGLMVASSTPSSGVRTIFLDTTTTINPWVNSITAIPEPNSFLLLGLCGAECKDILEFSDEFASCGVKFLASVTR